MATLNLGRIKPVFRGAYSGSTAYVVDDIVTSGGSSYICIQAHGAGTQAVSQTAYWTLMAEGGDVASTLTTQGDILYRDGSGLQRLAKGTASQQLRMNSGANAPEWFTASGGGVLQVKELIYHNLHGVNNASMGVINSNFKVDITPTAADSKFLLHTTLSLGTNHHDTGCTVSFFDSQVGTSGDSDCLTGVNNQGSGAFGNRIAGGFAGAPPGAWNGSWDDYNWANCTATMLYTPSSQNTNQRTFYPAIKRNGYSYNTTINYSHTDNAVSMAGISMIRVMEIANSIT